MRILCTISFLLATLSIFGQAPQAFNYSAIVRNGSGSPLPNQAVNFRLSILRTTAGGTNVYSETQAATTDPNGIVNLEIGKGSVVSGNFSSIAWGNDAYFLQIEVDPAGGTAFQVMGTTQFLSVPYAMYSRYAESTLTSTSTLDTIQAASTYDNNYYEVTPLSITTYVGGYYLDNMQADNFGNVVSNEYYTLFSNKYNGSTTFMKDVPYTSNFIRLDVLGNIYMTGNMERADTIVKFDGLQIDLRGKCRSSVRYIAKYDKNGTIAWAKLMNYNGCNNDIYWPSPMDVDSVGNSYVLYKDNIFRFNSNGDSLPAIHLADTTAVNIDVNDKGEYVLTRRISNIQELTAYNSNNTVKWVKQLTGLGYYDCYYDNDGKFYFQKCYKGCFSIGGKQYCERADVSDTYKLIGLNNSGDLDTYIRFKTAPSSAQCVGMSESHSLFKIQGKLASIVTISNNFYNKGVMYPPGLYLIKF